ncbi:transporter substrate-binding domain-containing protein [Vibrio rotiferianus]|uniref:transporter substrate-binding domain-containing protein n=1 Tax=Vibrio rotiferianus TaxID=190895 RepID=UPI00406A59AC
MPSKVLQFRLSILIRLGVCFLIVLGSTLNYANSQDNKFAPNQIEKPELVVGLPEYALIPYSYQHQTNSGQLITEGLLISMLDQVSNQAGFRYKIELYPTFSDVLNAFQQGELDLLVGVSATPERQSYMTFSEPMFSIRRAVITQQHSISELSDLSGANLAIEKGFALNDLLPNLLPQSQVTTLDNTQAAFEAIAEGSVDGYIGDALALSTLLKNTPRESLVLSILPDLPADHLHFAVKKGKHKLLSRINFALEDIKSQSIQAIYNQWLTPAQHGMLLDYGALKLTQEEKTWLDKNPTITVGVDANWAPYDFLDGEQYSGLSADVLGLISNILGVTFIPVAYSSETEKQIAFENGELMALTGATPSAETRRTMDFSQPYSHEPWVLLSRAEQLSNFAPNGSEPVAIIEHTGGASILATLCLTCRPTSFINHVSAFQSLQKGQTDYVLASLHHAAPLLHNDYVGQFKVSGVINEQNSAPLTMAVNFRYPMLLSILNKAIDALPPQELDRLEKKWLNYEYQEGLAPREVAKWSAIIGTAILCLILGIVLWNRKMAAEIEQRKIAENRAKKAEAHLQTLADNINGVVLQHTQKDAKHPLDVHFIFVSAGVREMFALSPESIQQNPSSLFSLIAPDRLGQLEQEMRDAIKVGRWESEHLLASKHSEEKWVRFNSHISATRHHQKPLRSGKKRIKAKDNKPLLEWNTVVTDITELKKQQQALDYARQKAESATAAKSQFLATISHEVRTPISGILGLLELMQEHNLSDELLNLHAGIHQSARNLLHIVNDVLDYSKIEAGKLEITPTEIELGKVLARIVQPQSIHAQQKGLAFHYWQDPKLAQTLVADDIRLHQILNNFLNNAIKFTEHGVISLGLDVLETTSSAQTLSLTVSDTGIGIPKEKQHTLFQPFEQVDKTTSRRFGGTGLGLSIALKLIKQMNGELKLHSEEGKGSQFTLVLRFPIVTNKHHPTTPTLALPDNTVDISEDSKQTNSYSNSVLIVGYFIQQEELCRYLKHLGLEPKVMNISQKNLLQDSVINDQPKHIFVAMSVWQQLAITDAWIETHAPGTRFTVINQSPMLSPEPLGKCWCLSVNPLMPDNLVHVLTKPVSHEPLLQQHESDTSTPTPKESREQAELNGRLILVAEDHPINQQVISKQLEKIGVHADIVDDGQQALDALKSTRYGLLLTDCHMPEMDGYTLSATIRKIEQQCDEQQFTSGSEQELYHSLPEAGITFLAPRAQIIQSSGPSPACRKKVRLPIVALTANAVQGEDTNCYEHGMDDFLVKPVSIKQLKLTVEKWLPPISTTPLNTEIELNNTADNDSSSFSDLFSSIEFSMEQASTSEDKPNKSILAEQESSRPEQLQFINHQELKELFGDRQIIDNLLREFNQTLVADSQQLPPLWKENQYESLRATAHRMKGAAQMVTCDAIARPLAELEKITEEMIEGREITIDIQTKVEHLIDKILDLSESFEKELLATTVEG